MSASTQDLIPLLPLADTFGALYIAGNFAAILFGLSNVQAFIYFQTRRGTKMSFLKLVIICLWTLDGLHLASIIHSVYYYLVIDHANVTAATPIVWSFKLQVLIDIIIIYVVHLLYVYRIWIVSMGRSRVLPITVGTITVLVLGVYVVLFWAIYQCHVLEDLGGIAWMTFMTLGVIATVDVVLASSLCYLLVTSRTGFSSTDSILRKLMVYTINTGCLTSVFSIAVIITYAVMPTNFVFLGLEFLIAKLYVNSFLAFLNAQYYLQPNKDIGNLNYSKHHVHRGPYRPELHVNVLGGENSQGFRTDMFKYCDEEIMDLTRPPQAATR